MKKSLIAITLLTTAALNLFAGVGRIDVDSLSEITTFGTNNYLMIQVGGEWKKIALGNVNIGGTNNSIIYVTSNNVVNITNLYTITSTILSTNTNSVFGPSTFDSITLTDTNLAVDQVLYVNPANNKVASKSVKTGNLQHTYTLPRVSVNPYFSGYNDTWNEDTITNWLNNIGSNSWTSVGVNTLCIDDAWQATNRTADGRLLFSATRGNPTNINNVAHSNGILTCIYMEPNPTWSAGGIGTDDAHFDGDIRQRINEGWDIIRLDFPGVNYRDRLYWLKRARTVIDSYGLTNFNQFPTNASGARSKLTRKVMLESSGWTWLFDTNALSDVEEAAKCLNVMRFGQDWSLGDLSHTWQSFLTNFHWTYQFKDLKKQGLQINAILSPFWGTNFSYGGQNYGNMGVAEWAMYSMAGFCHEICDMSGGPGAAGNYQLTNKWLNKIRLDPLDYPADLILTTNNLEVYRKFLSDGSIAFAWLNLTTNATKAITNTWQQLGLSYDKVYTVYDAINDGASVGDWTNKFGTSIASKIAGVYIFIPKVDTYPQADFTFYPHDIVSEANATNATGITESEDSCNLAEAVQIGKAGTAIVSVPVPNWATSIVSIITYHWSGSGALNNTNTLYVTGYGETTSGGNSGRFTIANLDNTVYTLPATNSTSRHFSSVTNTIPITNTDPVTYQRRLRVVWFSGQTNSATFQEIVKWRVQCYGTPDFNNQ